MFLRSARGDTGMKDRKYKENIIRNREGKGHMMESREKGAKDNIEQLRENSIKVRKRDEEE